MKHVQKDTKYIIKRILIGVGIALILGLLKTNNVFAESVPDSICAVGTYSVSTFHTCDSSNIYSSDYVNINNDFKYYSSLNNYDFSVYNITFYNSDLELYTIVEYYSSSSSENLFVDPYNYIGLYDLCNYEPNDSYCQIQDNTRYMLFYSKNQLDLNNNINFPMESGNIDILRNGYYKYIYITDNSNTATYINNHLYNNVNNITQTININSKPYYLFSSYYVGGINNKDFLIGNNTSIYKSYTNFSNANDIFYFWNRNNSKQEEQVPFAPIGYSEINISDNQAVYFLPKNYNDIQIESVQTGGSSEFPLYTNYIDFNYYFIGSVKDGYFPVNNLSDLTFKNVLFSSPPSALYVDSYFPMYQGGDDRSGYQYYSYIIFNNYDSDTTIYYNGTLFNAFIIEDIENYNETNCFIDRDNNNFCISFDFQNEVNNAWLKGFITDDDFVGNQENEENNLSKIFDKLKIPFTWFKSLTTYTCSNISLPIPFVNNSITLNCLSSKFHQILGDNFYNIIFIIINGLYAYRITILNIDSITDSLDPNDDKLEVIDL